LNLGVKSHCKAGAHRAAAVSAGIILTICGVTTNEAISMISRIHRRVDIKGDLYWSLKRLQLRHEQMGGPPT
jgi:hypothetical protein